MQSGFPLGYVFAALVVAAISAIVGNAAMLAYGWRIAFMTGVIPVFLALGFGPTLHESPEFEKAKASGKIEKAPFFSLFKPPQLWAFLQVFVFMTGLFLTDYSVYGYLPSILTLHGRGFDTTTYSLIYGFALFLSFLGYNFYGWLSDRTGASPDPVVLRVPGHLCRSGLLRALPCRGCHGTWAWRLSAAAWRAC